MRAREHSATHATTPHPQLDVGPFVLRSFPSSALPAVDAGGGGGADARGTSPAAAVRVSKLPNLEDPNCNITLSLGAFPGSIATGCMHKLGGGDVAISPTDRPKSADPRGVNSNPGVTDNEVRAGDALWPSRLHWTASGRATVEGHGLRYGSQLGSRRLPSHSPIAPSTPRRSVRQLPPTNLPGVSDKLGRSCSRPGAKRC